ncbi:UvrD-helicase domain-containing protein [Arthrobacter sp. I2-34]|uniref:UvrD-helicase domain-containing protein n=1 Tax=Arthrobacter hankyongi TaxID=2904801 RepID=A0ABS9LDI5_9MICC|nr:UvrD-helicase domain-containing protein [Arthrobacter hankyongi]MCG2624739.1 UvrD-helicase domain-containing protein [Arthrobacter hankyongi]
MMHKNHLTLAVAGSRKTQSIIDACIAASKAEKVLVLTYTTTNQIEIRQRMSRQLGGAVQVEVLGWFTFLIKHWVRPFVPFLDPHRRVRGFDFESDPQRYMSSASEDRYFDNGGRVRKVHLPQLACLVERASRGALLSRLERIYDTIYIDEVQDLGGYDLEILKLLMKSSIKLRMVGDVRQAVLTTNERERKNKQYMFTGVWKWFKAQAESGKLDISQRHTTWRCHPEIAAFADSVFGESWGFTATKSMNERKTEHDGMFLVKSEDVPAYVEEFKPLCLRYMSSSAQKFYLPFMNYRASKGLTRERVLIAPTTNVERFIKTGKPLEAMAAATFYVAITRAEQSVAIILDTPGTSGLPYWNPQSG